MSLKKKGGTKGPQNKVTKVLSRKEKRKESRIQKKKKKEVFLLSKYGKTESFFDAPQTLQKTEKELLKESRSEHEEKKKVKRQKEAEKHRQRRLKEDNLEEERNIAQLEKKLRICRGKSKKNRDKDGRTPLPKSFTEDGLDFLLDVCDSNKMDKLREEGVDAAEWGKVDSEDEENEKEDQPEDDGSDDEEGSDMEDLDNLEGMEDISDEEEEGDSEEEQGFDDLDALADGLGEESEQEEGMEVDEEEAEEEEEEEEEESGEDEEEEEEEGLEDEEEAPEVDTEPKTYEDIYGRLRDKVTGEVLKSNGPDTTPAASSASSAPSKYIPPALRAKMAASGGDDAKRREQLARLEKKVKGLLNRLAASNMPSICREIESLFRANSRNDMNETLQKLFRDALISPVLTPERLLMEHAALIGVLHANVGSEVGATMLQAMVKSLHAAHMDYCPPTNISAETSKIQENYVLFIAFLYVFKVTDSTLVFDILNMFADSFSAKDVELLLVGLKTIGFGLRKDDPAKLKDIILKIQKKSSDPANADLIKDTRTKFMLEILLAIKNNNIKKIPNYDNDHQVFLLKNMKAWYRAGVNTETFNIRMEDLLRADERGRWWVVGSAWTGREQADLPGKKTKGDEQLEAVQDYSSELLELSRKMRMNTDTRRMIFCTVMSAEDTLDAFEKVAKLVVKKHKEREVAFVLLDCCIQERKLNPFYAQLTSRLCAYERKYKLAAQYAVWDRVKDAKSLKTSQLDRLALFMARLIIDEALSVDCLKVIEFADLNKTYVRLLKSVLKELLSEPDVDKVKKQFRAVAGFPKLKVLREGLGLFLRHFLLKDEPGLKARVEVAERAMAAGDTRLAL